MNSTGNFRVGCWIIALALLSFIILLASSPSLDLGTFIGIFTLIIIAVIIAIIYWTIGTAKAVKEICVYTRDAIIGLFTVKREIKQKCPDALKALILEKKKHSVSVGIFEESNTKMTEKITISGDGIVDDSIQEGQIITF